ncbi:MAG: ABC transporter, partial [Lachnospiraceae bacterium]|nr:ABC transporter [Lachnospiraceae bacterium]
MTAVYRKELKSFWGSLSGWLFIAVNLFFSGWYFRYYGLIMGYPYIAYVCSNITIIIILSLPFITMRTISEEMRLRTDQLLFTSPVPIWKVVVGKYLALLTIFA